MTPLKSRSDDPVQLLRIAHFGNQLQALMADTTEEMLWTNTERRLALSMACFAILEGVYMLTKEFKEQIPGIDWRVFVGSRHLFTHDYIEVTPPRLWETIHSQVLPAMVLLAPYIEALQRSKPES